MNLLNLTEVPDSSRSFIALADADQAAIDALPRAVYVCAGDGRVIRYNSKAVELWGRTPRIGDPDERFCGSFRLYCTDGTPLPHHECPMAVALVTGESFSNLEVVVERPDGGRCTILVDIAPLVGANGEVAGAVNCFHDITELKQREDRLRHLTQELNHRVKNTLATVHSIALNTARTAETIAEFTSRFESRLLALGEAHALLRDEPQAGTSLSELLAHQLEPFAAEGSSSVSFEGPPVELQPSAVIALGMVFHELMTNAAKYGPLSNADGRISVNWTLEPRTDGSDWLAIRWVECGGPPVEIPKRRGFGTRLIERTVAGLGGKAELEFDRSGLVVEAAIPLHR